MTPITLLTNHPKFDKHIVYVLPSYVRNKIMHRSIQVRDCKQPIQELYISTQILLSRLGQLKSKFCIAELFRSTNKTAG
jgi:hypothetical protein